MGLQDCRSQPRPQQHALICTVWFMTLQGIPGSSAGEESACNAGDPGSIPGLGRSPEEGIGHPLQYSWASLVPQLVKNPPAMLETWLQSLDWGDPLEKRKTTHSSILAWRIPWTIQLAVFRYWNKKFNGLGSFL